MKLNKDCWVLSAYRPNAMPIIRQGRKHELMRAKNEFRRLGYNTVLYDKDIESPKDFFFKFLRYLLAILLVSGFIYVMIHVAILFIGRL